MKNTINDLNNILFEQIERINDDSLTGDELKATLDKAEAITKISATIISSANIQLRAYQEFGRKVSGETARVLGIEE